MIDIRTARKEAGFTQEELARIMGINRATLSKYESGSISPTIDVLSRIATILQRPVTDLLGEDKPDDFGWSTNEKAVDMQNAALENRLLISFYGLSFNGKTKVIEYAEDLYASNKYPLTPTEEATETGEISFADDSEGNSSSKQKKPPQGKFTPNDGKQ